MHIAVLAPENPFTADLFTHLREQLPSDTLTPVLPKSPIPEAAKAAEILIALGPVSAETIAALPKLALIQTASDGYETVDMDAATAAGIYVSFAPGDPSGNADSVAEFAIFLLLAATRHATEALRSIHDPATPRPLLKPAPTRTGYAIVGLGDIGLKIADRLRPFGVRLSAVDPHPNNPPADIAVDADLHAGLAKADAVILAVRASKQTEGMIDAPALAAMKPGATLINIARGSLIHEDALLATLNSGHLAAAGLDVLTHEPPQPTDPLVQHPHTFVTPHVAGFTTHTLEGTKSYLVEVITGYKQNKAPKSLLNKPNAPRHPLTQ